MAILRIRDENGQVKEIVALRGEKGQDGTVAFDSLTDSQKASLKGEKGDKGDNAVTDQTYNPTSENAQSGKAVEQAICDHIDETYNGASPNAQSGNAVREAINSRIDDWFDSCSPNAQSGNAVKEAILYHIDENYNEYSRYAQSGLAVKAAIDDCLSQVDTAIGARIYSSTDKEYSPTSENAQSGIAVAQAIASVGGGNEKEWELLEDITLTEDLLEYPFDLAKINTKDEIHIEGYIVPKDNTIASQTVQFNDGTVRWQTSISCKNGKFYLLMDVYKSPRNIPIFDGTVSVYNYSVSNNNSFKITSFDETLSVADDNRLIKSSSFRLRTSLENPMTVGTRIKVWGR